MKRWISAVFALLASPAMAGPPAGELDPAFGTADGVVITDFGHGGGDTADAIAQDAEGRLWLAGMTYGDTDICLSVSRCTADGAPDSAGFHYGPGGFCLRDVLDANTTDYVATPRVPMKMFVATDGSPYVVGHVSFNGPLQSYVCRFNPDVHGRICVILDAAGNYGGAHVGPAMAVRGDELLVVAAEGEFPVLFRLALADLSIRGKYPLIDDPGALSHARAWDADITHDGQLVVVGVAQSSGDNDFFVARFDLDSNSPDTGFDGDGFKRIAYNAVESGFDQATSVRVAPDGDMLVLGSFERANGKAGIGIVRLDPSGEYDITFNGGSPLKLLETFNVDAMPRAIDVLESGKIVVAGSVKQAGGEIDAFAVRLLPDGNFDPVFSGGHPFFDPTGYAEHVTGMVLQGDRLVLGGYVDYLILSGGPPNSADFMSLRVSDGRLIHDSFEAPDIASDK